MTRNGPRRAALRTAALTTVATVTLLAGAASVPTAAGSSQVTGARSGQTPDAPHEIPGIVPDDNKAIITLTSLSPTVLDGVGSVFIKGTVTAPASGPLVGGRVDVILGSMSLTHRADVDTWAKGTNSIKGRLVGQRAIGDVPAGETRSFTAEVREASVAVPAAFAALPIAVDVLQQGASKPTGSTRTFLAWNPRKEYEPLQIATAIPVTLDPDRTLWARNAEARADAWVRAIGSASRIARIVDGTAGSAVTLAVDPSVLGPAEPPTGHTTEAGAPSATAATTASQAPSGPSPSGTTSGSSSGTGSDTSSGAGSGADSSAATGARIAALTDTLAARLRGRPLWALPYADADIAATADLDPANSLARDLISRSSTLGARLGKAVRGDIAWPVDGLLPNSREARIQTAYSGTSVKKAAAVVVDERAITADSAYTPTARRVGAGGTRLLGYDQRLSALLPRAAQANATIAIQRYLAETLVLLGERPGTTRSVLVVADRRYNPSAGQLAQFLRATTSGIPWITTVSADALLADTPGDHALAQQKPAKAPASAAPRAALSTGRLARLAAQRDTLVSVATVLRDGAVFEQTYRELLDELASVRWRYQRDSWAAISDTVTAETNAATSALRVVPQRSRVNFLAEKGTLRVTIENGLDYAVQNLRLVLVPTNPRMQILQQPDPLSIAAGPGAKQNVNVRVRAVAAGRADIQAYLTTADGTRIGTSATIPVSANPLDSTIYWIGGVLAGLVLAVGLVRTLLKGTSRIDEIGDLEVVAERDEAAQNRDGD